MQRSLVLALVLFVYFTLPLGARAYFTTAQHAYTANGETAVFIIDFSFGHKEYDMALPVAAQRTFNTKSTTTLQFEILDEDNKRGNGSIVAAVLSNLKPENSMYVVPKGTKEQFRLVAFYKRTSEETGDAFRAQVTHLPVTLLGFEHLKLNPSELVRYTTNYISLQPGIVTSASSKN